MTSNSLTQITVPFHSAELYLVEHNGQPYTAMRPIVENMGLDWKAQLVKIKQRFSSVVGEITTTGKDGKQYQMLCLPLKKLFGWLMTISPNKVKPELRDTIIMYQNECDDVLWDYWIKGKATNPRTNKEDRVPLKDAVNMLVAKSKALNYSDAYKLVHQRFGIKHVDELSCDMIPSAVEYVHHLMGEYIPKAEYIDPDLKALETLSADVTNKVMDYYWSLHTEIERLGGKVPKYPQLDTELIVRAVVTRMLQSNRMMLSFDHNQKPIVNFVPNNAWILHDANIANIIGDPSGVSKSVLPDIIKSAVDRMSK